MNIAGNTKTSPAHGQTVEEYLQEPQPHLNYLVKAPKTVQKIALRIWASTEGCMLLTHIQNKHVYPCLSIGCSHPVLAEQLQQIGQQLSINFTIQRVKKGWSGIASLRSSSIRGCIDFLKLGGFIKGIKISAQSKYHKDIDKDILTLGILEYIIQRKTTKKWPKKPPIVAHHRNINKIIKNREYKSENYYINYFLEDKISL